MDGVVLRPGEGESLFDGRIVIKADFDQLCITESHFDSARDGASPHFHRQHADSFYVLEGGLQFWSWTTKAALGRTLSPLHRRRSCTASGPRLRSLPQLPHSGRRIRRKSAGHEIAESRGLRQLRRAGRKWPPRNRRRLPRPGEGERLEGTTRIATIKVGREELALIEFELEPGFVGPDPHSHDDHIDSFYVLDGEPEFFVGGETLRLGSGSFVAAPLGAVHAFSNPGPDRARLLNIHAPSVGFHEWLRTVS